MMTLKAWKDTGKHLTCKSYRLFYQESAKDEKETLLLIHGFPTASWDWYKVWDALTARFHVLAPDMLGFGFSDKPKNHD